VRKKEEKQSSEKNQTIAPLLSSCPKKIKRMKKRHPEKTFASSACAENDQCFAGCSTMCLFRSLDPT
jgi:hypothetical protein